MTKRSLLGSKKGWPTSRLVFLRRSNSKFPASPPLSYGSPPGLKIYILRDIAIHLLQRDTSQKIAKTLKGRQLWWPFFPFYLCILMYFILNENIMKTFSVSVRRRWSNTLQRKKRGNYATRSVVFFLCCSILSGRFHLSCKSASLSSGRVLQIWNTQDRYPLNK